MVDVMATTVFLAFEQRPQSGIFLILVDAEATNHYQAVDSILGAVLDKPILKPALCLPTIVLNTLLKLAGRFQAGPRLIYDAVKLYSWRFRRTADFDAELQRFAQNYQTENCAS